MPSNRGAAAVASTRAIQRHRTSEAFDSSSAIGSRRTRSKRNAAREAQPGARVPVETADPRGILLMQRVPSARVHDGWRRPGLSWPGESGAACPAGGILPASGNRARWQHRRLHVVEAHASHHVDIGSARMPSAGINDTRRVPNGALAPKATSEDRAQ
jgi:hypothetical protein